MPTGVYTRWDLEPQTSRFPHWQNKTRSFENKVMSIFQQKRLQNWELINNRQTEENSLLQFWLFLFSLQHCAWNRWVAFTIFVPVKKSVRLSLKKIFNVVVKRESSITWDEAIYEKNASHFLKRGSVIGEHSTRQAIMSKKLCEKFFQYKRSIAAQQLSKVMKTGKLFGYVQMRHRNTQKFESQIFYFPSNVPEHFS